MFTKKQYLSPTIQAYNIETMNIICGSGGNKEVIPASSATQPTPTNGIITSESKSIFVDEDDSDVEW